MRIKNNKQTSPMTHGEFLISMTPEAIEWNLLFEGVEIALISGDPNQAGSPVAIHPQFMQQWSDPLAYSTDPITDLKRIFRQCAKREIADSGLVHGCPVNNLAQEMSPLDEKFRKSLAKIYGAWRETVAAAFARGIKAGKVRKDVRSSDIQSDITGTELGTI